MREGALGGSRENENTIVESKYIGRGSYSSELKNLNRPSGTQNERGHPKYTSLLTVSFIRLQDHRVNVLGSALLYP